MEAPPPVGTQLIEHEGKEGEAGEGSEAVVPPASPADVRVDQARLYCSLCSSSVKSPIYQCAVGHMVCCACRVKLPDSACRTCRGRGRAGSAYAHCPGLDVFFAGLRVPCNFEEYGCRSFVPYLRADEHRAACDHAPCFCPEPGCRLACAPRALAAHLAGDHSWPADRVRYGTPLMLAVPVPAAPPARHLQLLRWDDASAFVLAAGPLGDGAAVSLVLVRGNAPVHPRFECTLLAKPPPEAAALGGACFFATMPVRSCALGDGAGVAPEKEVYFAVPRQMLCGVKRELAVSVRIDRSLGPEPSSSEDKKTITGN